MTKEIDKIFQNLNRLKSEYGDLFTDVEKILFSHDPIDIAYIGHENVADNPDEYAPEVEAILPRLGAANTVEDVTNLVYEEFINKFGEDESVGPKQKYEALSVEIWVAWKNFNKHKT